MDSFSRSEVWKLRFLAGFISFIWGQLLLGPGGTFWFRNMYMLLLILPLYLIQTSLFVTFAIKLRRVGFGHLYLWGCLFGSFDLWISAWQGMQGTVDFVDTAGGSLMLGGLGVYEAVFLVFLWHPLISFILPLSISLRLLSVRPDDFSVLLPGLVPLTYNSKEMWFVWRASGFVMAASFYLHAGSDARTFVVALVFSMFFTFIIAAVVWLWSGRLIQRSRMMPFAVYDAFNWSSKEIKVGSVVLGVLYLVVIFASHVRGSCGGSLIPELVAFSVIGVLFLLLLLKPGVGLDEFERVGDLALLCESSDRTKVFEPKYLQPMFYLVVYGMATLGAICFLSIDLLFLEFSSSSAGLEVFRIRLAWIAFFVAVATFGFCVSFLDRYFTYPISMKTAMEPDGGVLPRSY